MYLLTDGGRPLPDDCKICASHIDFAINTRWLQYSIDGAVEVLKHYEFDAIAFRGMSGALIAPSIALRLNKSMILVRKGDDTSHSGMQAEGDITARTYVIVDDFQSTGNTAKEIVKGVRRFASNAVFLGFLPVRGVCSRMMKGEPLEELMHLDNVECYNFPEGKAPQLTKVNGKWTLMPCDYYRALNAQNPDREEMDRRREQALWTRQRIRVPISRAAYPGKIVVDEAAQAIVPKPDVTFDFKETEGWIKCLLSPAHKDKYYTGD